MTKFYFSEIKDKGAYARAERLDAETLEEAMTKAEEKQCFQCTFLEIGTEIDDETGFLLNRVAMTNEDGEWAFFDNRWND